MVQVIALGFAWIAGRASLQQREMSPVSVPPVLPVACKDQLEELKKYFAAQLDLQRKEILQDAKRQTTKAHEKLLLELSKELRRNSGNLSKKLPRGGIALVVAQKLKVLVNSHVKISTGSDKDVDRSCVAWRIIAPFSEEVAQGRSTGLTPERMFEAIKASGQAGAAKCIAIFNLSDFGTFAEFNKAADFTDDRASLLSVLYALNREERHKIPDEVKHAWKVYIIDDITMPADTSYEGVLDVCKEIFGEKTSLLGTHVSEAEHLAEAIFRLN